VKSVLSANIPNLFLRRRVVDVRKIPGKQKIYSIDRAQRNVDRVILGIYRNGLLANQCPHKFNHLR